MYHLAELGECGKFVLNFSTVDFIGSVALGKLITLDRKVKARGGMLKLSNIRPQVYERFKICRLDRLFDIYADEADALAAF